MNSAALTEGAPAKLNLGLRVVGRRPDGFHDLDSLFVHLALEDTLTLAAATAGAHGQAAGDTGDHLQRVPAGDAYLDAQPLPLNGDNLVLRAARAYRQAAAAVGVRVPPCTFKLTKRIPWGAGLAGGSADAAAALRLLARTHPAAVPLAPLAEALGSDVPFSLSLAPAARVQGRGERVTPMTAVPLTLLLVFPGVAVSTPDAFRWWGEARVDVPAPDPNAWRGGNIPALHNALQPAVAARVPVVAEALAALAALDLGPVAMSGSGATCFAVSGSHAFALAAAERLRALHPGWWVAVTQTRV